jgi:hypothetical protein
MSALAVDRDSVGPVLESGEAAGAVIAAIREAHPGARVIDRGAYLRVLVPGRCTVTRASIEKHTRGPFRLPSDLEKIMPSFKGRLTLSEDEARWELAGHAHDAHDGTGGT